MALRDPHVPGSWGACPVLVVTGLPCPGCGGLRAVSDLLHGDVLGALGSNALVVALVLLGALAWATWTASALRRRQTRVADAVTDRRAVAAAVVLVIFTVVRWLPGAGVLGP